MHRIVVNQLSKKYKKYKNHRQRIFEWITGKKMHEEKWVLKDLNFHVEDGQSIGIIGHNGAGKSTLLKILTGTVQPTTGEYQAIGRVSALLELGMGFHPDFTGIQNVYMSGQLSGLSNQQITELLPAIEAFAEIGDYIHEPLRTYSSGMSVRLAFSVATALRPDILIIDEALSVGDAYFQHKCFDRIRKFRKQGTSLLFVSHDPGAVKNLCDRAILLDQGLLVKDGSPEEVIDYYNAIIAQREADYEIKQTQGSGERVITRSGNKMVEIVDVKMVSGENEVFAVQVGERVKLRVKLRCLTEVVDPTVGIMIKDRLGNEIFGTNTYHLSFPLGQYAKGETFAVDFIMDLTIGVGNYSVTIAAHDGRSHVENNYDWWDHAFTFQMIRGSQPHFDGVNYLPTTVELVRGGKFDEHRNS